MCVVRLSKYLLGKIRVREKKDTGPFSVLPCHWDLLGTHLCHRQFSVLTKQ